jgi:hypothetical protein
MKEEKSIMPLAIAIVYFEPSSHLEDCYFYLIKIEGLSKMSIYKVQSASVPSAMKPLLHVDNLTVLTHLPTGRILHFLKNNCRKDHIRTLILDTFPRVMKNHI